MANPEEVKCEGVKMPELGAEAKPDGGQLEQQLMEELKRAMETSLPQ